MPPFRVSLAIAALLIHLPIGRSADDASGVKQPKKGEFVFSLLPKAFQRTPDLEMTVNTETTAYGRLLRTPTPSSPAYYIALSSGYKQRGDTVGGEKSPPPEQIARAMQKALAVNGYLPADQPAHQPTLAIFYFWGSHNRMDREMEAQFPQLAAKHRLERAMLVGGHHEVDRQARVLEWGENLTDRTPEYEYLRDQALDDLYFVVASAYDYVALAHKERKLVWRTTMTVSARGVSMSESLSPLIMNAGPFFGRETVDPQIIDHRIERWGVRVGEPTVVDDNGQPPKPATPTGGAPTR